MGSPEHGRCGVRIPSRSEQRGPASRGRGGLYARAHACGRACGRGFARHPAGSPIAQSEGSLTGAARSAMSNLQWQALLKAGHVAT